MTEIQAIAAVVLSVVVPFIVQAIKSEALTGNAARIIALAASVIAGAITALVGGIPTDPAGWVTCIFALIGGVQTAYTLFKGVGITSKWLDALLALGNVGGKDEQN